MLMYNKSMGIILNERSSGFTIIEIMLFLALSGLLMVGVLAGTNASIANQRYKDAVEDAVNALRNAYSFVADTEIHERDSSEGCDRLVKMTGKIVDSELGRGRTSCAVYGAVVTINKDVIQTTTLIGKDYYDVLHNADHAGVSEEDFDIITNSSSSDISVLKALSANNVVQTCDETGANCTVSVAGSVKNYKLKWGTVFKKRNTLDEAGKNNDLYMTLLIYRSPSSGAIRTLIMDDVIRDAGKPVDYDQTTLIENRQPKDIGVYGYIDSASESFSQKDAYFCVDSVNSESYSSHDRIIRIAKNAHSQSGIILENMDDDIVDSEGNAVSCDK